MITLRIRFEIFLVVILLLIGCVPVVNAENASSGTNLTNITANSTVYPAEPFITIDPIGNHTIGDVFFLNGTTNLPVSENLTLEIRDYAWTWRLHMKDEPNVPPPGYYAYLPYVSIISGITGINQWSVNVTDAAEGLIVGRYEAVIFSEINSTCNRWGCPGSRAANLTDFTLFQGNTNLVKNYTPTQIQPPPSTLPLPSPTRYSTPLPWLLAITAFFAAILILKTCDERK